MALGAVFISLPTALVGSLSYSLMFRYGLVEAVTLYAALGLATMMAVTAALALSQTD